MKKEEITLKNTKAEILEEHSKVTVAEDGPTAAPTSMDKGIDAEEKSNKKGWFRKLFGKK